MIATKPDVIAHEVAEAARKSLDREIQTKRAEGVLQPGKRTLEKLQWTPQTTAIAQAFEKSPDFEVLEKLRLPPSTSKSWKIKWAGPMIYGDVLEKPITYAKVAPGYEVIGIIALGTLHLPEIDKSSPQEISSGSVAYFCGNSPVIYRSCGGGRGIMFYLSTRS